MAMSALVLLPGMDGTGDLFAPLIPSLDAALDVAVVRYPRDAPLDYSELEAIARSACPENRNYFLLGESFSGPLAIKIAATRPAGLLGIILCSTFATNPRPRLGVIGRLATLFPVTFAPARLISFALLGRFATRQLCRLITASVRSVGAKALQARLRAVLEVNVLADLAELRVPILCLCASEDRLVPEASLAQICAANPTVQVVHIVGPHCLLQARPQQAAAAINEFIVNHSNGLSPRV